MVERIPHVPLVIRWAEERDWPDLERWVRQSELCPDWMPVRNPLTLVGERNGILASGVSMTWGPWGYGTVDWMVRNPDAIGRGAGRALIPAVLAWLESLGVACVSSLVSERLPRVLAADCAIPQVEACEDRYRLLWIRFSRHQEVNHGEGK